MASLTIDAESPWVTELGTAAIAMRQPGSDVEHIFSIGRRMNMLPAAPSFPVGPIVHYYQY